MKPFDDLLERAKSDPRHIVLAEGEDARVAEGGIRALREGVARVTLLGRAAQVRELLRQWRCEDLPLAVVDPATSPDLGRFAEEHHARRRHSMPSRCEGAAT